MDPTEIYFDGGKGTREEEDRMAFQSLVSALNDSAMGHKEMLDAINRLVIKPKHSRNNLPTSPMDRGSTSNSGRHAYTHMQNTPHIYKKPFRPTKPHFLENATTGPIIPAEPSEPFGAYL